MQGNITFSNKFQGVCNSYSTQKWLNKIVLGIESSHNEHEISYDIAFLATMIAKHGLSIDCVGLKE